MLCLTPLIPIEFPPGSSPKKIALRAADFYDTSDSKRKEDVVAQWFDPLSLQPEQSGGVGSKLDRAPLIERHDKGSRTRLGQLYFCDPSACH